MGVARSRLWMLLKLPEDSSERTSMVSMSEEIWKKKLHIRSQPGILEPAQTV